MVSLSELRIIMPNLSAAKAGEYLPHLQAAMDEFQITTYLREAAFLAQIAHESGEFRWMEEIWGPTQDQKRYEKPHSKAAELGNSQAGDGKRFKGRGPIQLTGRFNYRRASQELGLANDPQRDLERNPTLVALPEMGFRVAGLYWRQRKINEPADIPDFREVTKRINTGLKNMEDRKKYYHRALAVLSKNDNQPVVSPGVIRIFVNGRDLTGTARPQLRNGRLFGRLRPLADAAGLFIASTADGIAVLRANNGETFTCNLLIEEGVGWVMIRDLPGDLIWDAATQTATLTV